MGSVTILSYSPKLNQIELKFDILKARIKKNCHQRVQSEYKIKNVNNKIKAIIILIH